MNELALLVIGITALLGFVIAATNAGLVRRLRRDLERAEIRLDVGRDNDRDLRRGQWNSTAQLNALMEYLELRFERPSDRPTIVEVGDE